MKVYCGRKDPLKPGSAEVFVNGKPLKPGNSLRVRNHSPDGFEWGYGGSGPAQLALAILLDWSGSTKRSNQWYEQFKAQVITGLGPHWVMTDADIMFWYETVRPEKLDDSTLEDVARAKKDPNAGVPAKRTTSDGTMAV